MQNISEFEDYLDVRDIIERFEELESERDGLVSDITAAEEDLADQSDDTSAVKDDAEELAALERKVDEAKSTLATWDAGDEGAEYKTLGTLLEDLKGNGGDEQWKGNWYPVTLIRDSYFEQSMDQLLEDIGELPKELPCYLRIEVDYVALKMDYSSVEFNDVTYWYR